MMGNGGQGGVCHRPTDLPYFALPDLPLPDLRLTGYGLALILQTPQLTPSMPAPILADSAPNKPGLSAATVVPARPSQASVAQRVLDTTGQMASAWQVLSGQQREFKFLHGERGHPVFVDFCFASHMTVLADGSTFHVAVLLDHADALAVACAMFDLSPHTIAPDDVRDASSEVCNIFSDLLSTYEFGSGAVRVGLPYRLTEDTYPALLEANGARYVFGSARPGDTSGQALRVILIAPKTSS